MSEDIETPTRPVEKTHKAANFLTGAPRSAASALLDDGNIAVDEIEQIEAISKQIVEQVRKTNVAPDNKKTLRRRFTITQAADMVGCSAQRIRNAEKDHNHTWGNAELNENGRRSGYTIAQINQMRSSFGTLPFRRQGTDEAIILALQNFKGGVGKSVSTVHLAHFHALKGYRVLVVDCDPQATTTSLFGFNPDLDVDVDQTLYPFFEGEQPDLSYAIRETCWDQCDLIPANLHFYGIEYSMHQQIHNDTLALRKLRYGLDQIKDDYDIILLDSPPALGVISLSVLNAADALVVPVRPSVIDFSSTSNFFSMLVETLQILEERNLKKSFKFVKLLVNDMDDSKTAHEAIHAMMDSQFGEYLLSKNMKDSAEIDNALIAGQSVYELEKPVTGKKTHDRCKLFLDAVNSEIELLIRRTWPSHVEQLREQGVIG